MTPLSSDMGLLAERCCWCVTSSCDVKSPSSDMSCGLTTADVTGSLSHSTHHVLSRSRSPQQHNHVIHSVLLNSIAGQLCNAVHETRRWLKDTHSRVDCYVGYCSMYKHYQLTNTRCYPLPPHCHSVKCKLVTERLVHQSTSHHAPARCYCYNLLLLLLLLLLQSASPSNLTLTRIGPVT